MWIHAQLVAGPAVLLLAALLFADNRSAWAAGPPLVTAPPVLNDPKAGQALAADLRNAQPAAAAELRGVLKLRHPDGRVTSLPLHSKILPGANSWQSFYQVQGSNWTETLEVRHVTGAPSEYRHVRTEATNTPAAWLPLCQEVWQPLAGSDFYLGDLGLEFFHWPTQVLLFHEMRKGRACRVLESRPAVPQEYARVLSWVDVETDGLLLAEAYDARNRRLKEFEVNKFKKSGEQWQLQQIEMRHYRGGSRTNTSRTTLIFDVPDQ